jgi:hypothetical protein
VYTPPPYNSLFKSSKPSWFNTHQPTKSPILKKLQTISQIFNPKQDATPPPYNSLLSNNKKFDIPPPPYNSLYQTKQQTNGIIQNIFNFPKFDLPFTSSTAKVTTRKWIENQKPPINKPLIQPNLPYPNNPGPLQYPQQPYHGHYPPRYPIGPNLYPQQQHGPQQPYHQQPNVNPKFIPSVKHPDMYPEYPNVDTGLKIYTEDALLSFENMTHPTNSSQFSNDDEKPVSKAMITVIVVSCFLAITIIIGSIFYCCLKTNFYEALPTS